MMEFLKGEAIALYGIVVVFGVYFTAALFGQFFGGIGDKLFGKKDKQLTPKAPTKLRIKD